MSTNVDTLDDTQNTNTEDEQIVSVEDAGDSSSVNVDDMSDEDFLAFMESTPDSGKVSTEEVKTKEVVVEEKENKETPSDVPKEVSETTNTFSIPEDYADVFKPFKANGKEITPTTVEDVRSLMQMGANYTKKMTALASHRRTAETLNKADIKEEDLNFLIDVHKGDKEAIKKLLDKHKVDPLELDMESTNYVAKDNMVSDDDVEYLSTLEDIQSSVPKISEIMSSKWDKASKEILLKDPKVLVALHEEIEMGRFDETQAQLELERTFGRYKNVPDIQAYVDIVSKKVAALNSKQPVTPTNISNSNSTPITTPKVQPNPSKSKAAPSKGVSSSRGSNITTKDLAEASDEEFLRLMAKGLA